MYSLILSFDKDDKIICDFNENKSRKIVDMTGHPQTVLIDKSNILKESNKISINNYKLFVVKNQFMINMARLTTSDNNISVLYMRDNSNNHMCMIENDANVNYINLPKSSK